MSSTLDGMGQNGLCSRFSALCATTMTCPELQSIDGRPTSRVDIRYSDSRQHRAA